MRRCRREVHDEGRSSDRCAHSRLCSRIERIWLDAAGLLQQQAAAPDRGTRGRQRLRCRRARVGKTSAKAHSGIALHHRPEHARGGEHRRRQLPSIRRRRATTRSSARSRAISRSAHSWAATALRPIRGVFSGLARPRFLAASARCGTQCRSKRHKTCSRAI